MEEKTFNKSIYSFMGKSWKQGKKYLVKLGIQEKKEIP